MRQKLLRYLFVFELVACICMWAHVPSFGFLDDCTKCSCKMTYAWMPCSGTNPPATGEQSQANPPQKVLQAVAPLNATACPDPGNIGNTTPAVDEYQYQNPSRTCKCSNNLDTQEADVSGAGTRQQIGVQAKRCIN
jgi:hypothetical protein